MQQKLSQDFNAENFWFFKPKVLWQYFRSESLAFKAICLFLFVVYYRPQEIYSVLGVIPWAQVAISLAFLGVFTDKRSRFRWSSGHTFVALFTVTIHMSFLVAFDLSYSLKNYVNFIQWIVAFYLITTIVTTKERCYFFFLVLFFCSLKIAIGTAKVFAMRGFSFEGWGLTGPAGYFENSSELAILMVSLVPFGYYLYNRKPTNLHMLEKLILLLAFIAPILTVLGASSRGGQLALVLQFAVIFWKRLFKLRVIFIVLVLAWGGWHVLPDKQKARFTTMGEDKTSVQRLLYWKNGWQIMKDNPVLGVGYWNFIPVYAAYHQEDMLYPYAELPHNIFIQIGTDAGFTGLFFFIMLSLIVLLKKFPKPNEPPDSLFRLLWKSNKLAIIGFLVAGQFVTVTYYPFFWIGISFQIALYQSLRYS